MWGHSDLWPPGDVCAQCEQWNPEISFTRGGRRNLLNRKLKSKRTSLQLLKKPGYCKSDLPLPLTDLGSVDHGSEKTTSCASFLRVLGEVTFQSCVMIYCFIHLHFSAESSEWWPSGSVKQLIRNSVTYRTVITVLWEFWLRVPASASLSFCCYTTLTDGRVCIFYPQLGRWGRAFPPGALFVLNDWLSGRQSPRVIGWFFSRTDRWGFGRDVGALRRGLVSWEVQTGLWGSIIWWWIIVCCIEAISCYLTCCTHTP